MVKYRGPQPSKYTSSLEIINPLAAKLFNFNFHPLEVVSRYRDPQLQVGENYSYPFNLRPNICKSWYHAQ